MPCMVVEELMDGIAEEGRTFEAVGFITTEWDIDDTPTTTLDKVNFVESLARADREPYTDKEGLATIMETSIETRSVFVGDKLLFVGFCWADVEKMWIKTVNIIL